MSRHMRLPPPRPRWSWREVAVLLALLFVMIPVNGVARAAFRRAALDAGFAGADLQSILLFEGTLVQALVMTVGAVALARRKGATSRELGLVWDQPVVRVLAGVAAGTFLAIAVMMVGVLIEKLAGPVPPQDVEKILRGLVKGRHFLLAFLCLSVLAPVSEELFFRGMVYPVIRARLGICGGIVLSAVFFGTLHLDIYRLLPLTLGGMGLAWLYEKTGSLLTPMVAHSTWNTMMLAAFFMTLGV